MNRRDSIKAAAAGLLGVVWPQKKEYSTTTSTITTYDPAEFDDDDWDSLNTEEFLKELA